MTKKSIKTVKVLNFGNEEEWLEARRGKITGTRLKDIVVKRGTKPKIGFYEMIAERIAIPPSNENRMDRGHRLEDEAIKKFEEETKKKVNTDLVMWVRGDNEDIALSPDGYIGKKEAVEVKCLSSARHLEAYLTQKIPNEYVFQKLQYFIVNDELKTLYFVFYDPRLPQSFFYLEFKREDMVQDIAEYLLLEQKTLEEVERISNDLTFCCETKK